MIQVETDTYARIYIENLPAVMTSRAYAKGTVKTCGTLRENHFHETSVVFNEPEAHTHSHRDISDCSAERFADA